jgi:hypothetical protein
MLGIYPFDISFPGIRIIADIDFSEPDSLNIAWVSPWLIS